MDKQKKGNLVISLDFELNWGVRDDFKLVNYEKNLLGVRSVVPALLSLFCKHGIHATWATVGLLFFRNHDELIKGLPNKKPHYENKELSPYKHMGKIGHSEKDDPYHYAYTLIKMIYSYPGQEIGSHTFSHYYCVERGQDANSFRDDLQAAINAAKKFPLLSINSIVFPRCQINEEYISICEEKGIKAYRGTESAWFYKSAEKSRYMSLARKSLRLLDSYLMISGHNCYSIDAIIANFPFNIPSSRFLRPYSRKLRFLEPLRLKRILSDLTYAAREGMVYHLWWHPHNFGVNMEQNLFFLEKILKHYTMLREYYGMECLNMEELSERLILMKNSPKIYKSVSHS